MKQIGSPAAVGAKQKDNELFIGWWFFHQPTVVVVVAVKTPWFTILIINSGWCFSPTHLKKNIN